MKKIIMIPLLLTLLLSSCTNSNDTQPPSSATDTAAQTPIQTPTQTTEQEGNKMKMIVGESEFTATLYDNETAKAFSDRLPLTLAMSELHGNEKYYRFDKALPTNADVPDRIHAGDIKLFGDDCLVVFYDDFSTSYSYTAIGKIDNPSGLAESLGRHTAVITFEKE